MTRAGFDGMIPLTKEGARVEEQRKVEIIDYEDRYKQALEDISLPWLLEYDLLEPVDLEMLAEDICQVTDAALAAYNRMRSVEGVKLAEDIANSQDPELIEEVAREDLGMVAPGEKIIRFSN